MVGFTGDLPRRASVERAAMTAKARAVLGVLVALVAAAIMAASLGSDLASPLGAGRAAAT